jgi:hypothetical protein
MKILEQALNKINPFHKKQKDFFITLIQSILGSVGKKTFRNLARYAQITEHTFARQMTKAFDFVSLNFELIKAYKSDFDVVIAAQDTSFVPKSGKQTYGLSWFWNGCAGKAEKGLELDVIATIKVGQEKNEAFTLSVQQTPANSIPKSQQKKKETTEKTRIDFALDHVQKILSKLFRLNIKYMVADAFYAKTKYVNGLLSFGLHVITKMRKDSRFFQPYNGLQKARGRKRITTNVKITPEDFTASKVINLEKEQIELRSCIAHSVAFRRKIKIVSVQKIIGTKQAEVFLCSTDLELNTLKIYQFYTARFQIEFIFRDAKGFTGLADCQSRDSRRINYHFNASLTALNFARLRDTQNQKTAQTNHPFSMTNLTREYHVEIVINRIFSMLGFDLTLIKSHPNFQKALAFGNVMH